MTSNYKRYEHLKQQYRICTPGMSYFIANRKKLVTEYDVIITHEYNTVGKNVYSVQLNKPQLDAEDLLIIADDGNLCFGGSKAGSMLYVYTD